LPFCQTQRQLTYLHSGMDQIDFDLNCKEK
jgi:hypothetical protein